MNPFYDNVSLDLRVAPNEIPSWIKICTELDEAFNAIGVQLLQQSCQHFEAPRGTPKGSAYTLCLIISTSHVIFHTAPEHHWVNVQISCCHREKLAGIEAAVLKVFERPVGVNGSPDPSEPFQVFDTNGSGGFVKPVEVFNRVEFTASAPGPMPIGTR